MERLIERLNHKEFKKLVPSEIETVILPVGTIEAHGPIPLGTDSIIPTNLAAEIAEKINALVAPAVNYGVTHSLLPYPGSLTINEDTYQAYIQDILLSLARNGFCSAVILNGHGGNTCYIRNAQIEVWKATGLRSILIDWWDLVTDVTEKVYGVLGGHAGVEETAMIMAIDKSLADPKLFDKDEVYVIRNGAYLYPNGGTILLSKENEGLPEYNYDEAKVYWDKVKEEIVNFLAPVLNKWRKQSE